MVEALSGTPVSPVRGSGPALTPPHARRTLCHPLPATWLGSQHAVAQAILPASRADSPISLLGPWRLAQGCTCRTCLASKNSGRQHCSSCVDALRRRCPPRSFSRGMRAKAARSLWRYVIPSPAATARHSREMAPAFLARQLPQPADEPIATSSRVQVPVAQEARRRAQVGSTASPNASG